MDGINVEKWTSFDPAVFKLLSVGYKTNEIYRVEKVETDVCTSITFRLEKLDSEWQKIFEHRATLLAYYRSLVGGEGISFVAKEVSSNRIVGIVIAAITPWHKTVNLWEFHTVEDYRGTGIGRLMMDSLVAEARQREFRVIEVETSNRNVGAIRFYRKMGFELEKLDMAFYTNDDLKNQDIAVFMKKHLS